MSDDIHKDAGQSSDAQADSHADSQALVSCDVTSGDIDSLNNAFAPTIWLEVLPSQAGTILAAILTNIMTEGLTPNQENILGNFVSAVGSLISYKAARDDTSGSTNP